MLPWYVFLTTIEQCSYSMFLEMKIETVQSLSLVWARGLGKAGPSESNCAPQKAASNFAYLRIAAYLRTIPLPHSIIAPLCAYLYCHLSKPDA